MQLVNSEVPPQVLSACSSLVDTAYLLCGLTRIVDYQKGMIYDNNSRVCAVPVNDLHRYKTQALDFDAPYFIADKPTLIANQLTDTVKCIAPIEPEHDPFTDLLCTLLDAIENDDFPMAFVTTQCYLLLNRIVSDRIPMLGGKPPKLEIKPYAI